MTILELEMFDEMKKYFKTDIINMSIYVNQVIKMRKTLNPTSQFVQIRKCNETIDYLTGRRNFANNCVSFLTRKINEFKNT